ncbi:hypothetical protein PCASD_06790 [Puccinia coronata f. sp. avenae]|uniref:Uncharacterized protein n=1 Tax=Puccinia coronata f. sp. avenae TaxID=200324 RepID=A0A2N5V0G5_9BASI|nr:hypothetical protein PCASD_16159 [Puccinia coronata f. sp. avenae]PLW43500.1 hypothetical protein PCASD_06790 [Puccinia coronata f. sp. avenae]
MVSTKLLPLALLALLLSFSGFAFGIVGKIKTALSFSNRDPNFQIDRDEMYSVVTSLAQTFTQVDEGGELRAEALPIESYNAFKDKDGQPMFPPRMAQVMKYLLEDMDHRDDAGKASNLKLLYVFSGVDPREALYWGTNTCTCERLKEPPKIHAKLIGQDCKKLNNPFDKMEQDKTNLFIK